jgi:N-acetylmuramoyl-L-alanine amidase
MFGSPHRIASIFTVFAIPLLTVPTDAQTRGVARVQAIRFWSFGDVTRIAIQTEGAYTLYSDQIQNPVRIYFDLAGLLPPTVVHHGVQTILVNDGRLKQIRVAEVSPGRTRIVFDLDGPADVVSSQLVNPDRLMIEIRPKGAQGPSIAIAHNTTGSQKVDLSTAPNATDEIGGPAVPNPTTKAVTTAQQAPVFVPASGASVPAVPKPALVNATDLKPTPGADALVPVAIEHKAIVAPSTTSNGGDPANPLIASHETLPLIASRRSMGTASAAKRGADGDRSLVRVFGLKLGKVVIDAGHGGHDTGTIGPGGLMEKDLVLDVALRLGKLIAQRLGAQVVYTRSGDVFIPLEERTKIANEEKADLFVSIHANSSPERSATGVETYYFNLTSDPRSLDLASRENATSASSISDLNDLLHRAVLQTKLEESREFAQHVQTTLWAASVKMNSGSRNRGVRRAPFVVLIGATMPSILAEIGFVSNPHDERLLRKGDQRGRIAEALYKGISQYASTLSHTQIARAGAE